MDVRSSSKNNRSSTAVGSTERAGPLRPANPIDKESRLKEFLNDEHGSGAGTRGEDKRDQSQISFRDEVPETNYIPAETTLKSYYLVDEPTTRASKLDKTRLHIDNNRTEKQRLDDWWKLNHGFGFIPSGEEIDEVEFGQRVDPEHRDRYRFVDAVMSQLGVPDQVREMATGRSLRGIDGGFSWNRWYAGACGLAIGHALVEMLDSPEEVKEEAIWDDIVRTCDSLPTEKDCPVLEARTVDPDALVNRAFEHLVELGGDEQ